MMGFSRETLAGYAGTVAALFLVLALGFLVITSMAWRSPAPPAALEVVALEEGVVGSALLSPADGFGLMATETAPVPAYASALTASGMAAFDEPADSSRIPAAWYALATLAIITTALFIGRAAWKFIDIVSLLSDPWLLFRPVGDLLRLHGRVRSAAVDSTVPSVT